MKIYKAELDILESEVTRIHHPRSETMLEIISVCRDRLDNASNAELAKIAIDIGNIQNWIIRATSEISDTEPPPAPETIKSPPPNFEPDAEG